MRTTIKKYRQNLNISQMFLAKKVGIDQSYVSKLEHDETRRVSFEVLEKISKVLRLCPVILIDGCSISNSGYCSDECIYYKSRYIEFNKLPNEAKIEFIEFINYLNRKYKI